LIVIDASVLANVVGDDGSDGRRARQEFRNAGDVAAPDLVDVETVAVLRKRWIAGTVSDRRFAAAVEDIGLLDLDRYPALPNRNDRLRGPVRLWLRAEHLDLDRTASAAAIAGGV
jgi:predicted nucleic acid-binding protein